MDPSGGIVRTIVVTALFVVLVCDYTTLIGQLYESVTTSGMTSTAAMNHEPGGGRGGGGGKGGGGGSVAVQAPPPPVLGVGAGEAFADAEALERSLLPDEIVVDEERLLAGEGVAKAFGSRSKAEVAAVVKNVCLPKLICELTSGANDRRLVPNELALLKLISETTLGTYAEVPSVYHFAAHMGQLVAGSDVGCHVFYSSCPMPGRDVLKMLKQLKR